MKLTIKQYQTECSHLTIEQCTERLEFWNGKPETTRDAMRACVESSQEEKMSALEIETAAIYNEWEESSPVEQERRRIKKEAYDNELLTCKRTGKQTPRKNCLVICGNSIYSIESLTKDEKDFLEIESLTEI